MILKKKRTDRHLLVNFTLRCLTFFGNFKKGESYYFLTIEQRKSLENGFYNASISNSQKPFEKKIKVSVFLRLTTVTQIISSIRQTR